MPPPKTSIVVLVSANTEWRVVRTIYAESEAHPSPLGEWFMVDVAVAEQRVPVLFFHGGWGKIAAAASAQFVIDHCVPDLLINLGTCGGFAGEIEKGTIVLAERTIVYDIIEQMTGAAEAIARYSTKLDLSWLGEDYPHNVLRTPLVSGDRDLVVEEISHLITTYGAVAGDWESGAIAFVAVRNGTRCLILRGVTDLVGGNGGEAYDGNLHIFVEGTTTVMRQLLEELPEWIGRHMVTSM
jgi:adenosylhomocysteine nucleosidase